MSTIIAPPALLTAEQYWALPDDGRRTELVRGRVVTMPSPGFEHGELCINIGFLIKQFLLTNPVGRIIGNDSGIVTERGPDTVRGPDLTYYSFAKVPASQSPKGYPTVPPELAIEVKSPSDRWNNLTLKAGELLNAGVMVVCIVDPDRTQAQVHRADEPVQTLKGDALLEFADVLPGFSVPVRQLFE
jgi:Uma2 family endonuclease